MPTTTQPQHSQELLDLRAKVEGLTTQVETLVKLMTLQATATAELTAATAASAAHQQQGNSYGHGRPPQHHLQPLYTQQHQWFGPQFAQPLRHPFPPPDIVCQQATPTRNNIKVGRPSGPTPGAKQPPKRNQTNDGESAAKREDDKETPTKGATPSSQPMTQNPYTQECQLQFRHAGSTRHYTPYNFVNNGYNQHQGPYNNEGPHYQQQSNHYGTYQY